MAVASTVFVVSNKYDSNSFGYLNDFQSINLPFLVLASLNGIYCFTDRKGIWTKLLYVFNHIFQFGFLGIVWYAAYYSLELAFRIQDMLRSENLHNILNDFWMFGLGLAITSFYIGCHGFPWTKNSPAILQFRQKWKSLSIPKDETKSCEKYLRKMSYIVTVTSILYVTFSILAYLHIVTALTIPRTFFEIMVYLEISSWTVSGAFILSFCISLCHIFSIANSIISPNQNFIQTNALERFAILHQQATELCAIFSKSFGFYILYTLLELSFEIIIYLDLLIVVNLPINEKFETGIYAIMSSTSMLVVWYTIASVNKEAYKSFDIINRIGCTSLRKLNPQQIELLLFQQCRIGNNTIGIEIPGLGVIKSGTLATICSVFCTYLFLLVQFQNDATNESTSSCKNDTS